MINKKSYKQLTGQKPCFCETRPDDSFFELMEYLWKDEVRNYLENFKNGKPPEKHILLHLSRIVIWLRDSLTSDLPYSDSLYHYYQTLIEKKREYEDDYERVS